MPEMSTRDVPFAWRAIVAPTLGCSAFIAEVFRAGITQLGKVHASGSFRFMETCNVVACVYLFVTLLLSLALRRLERALEPGRER